MNTPVSSSFARQRLSLAAALACGALLTACGGGGDSTPPATQTPLSQPDATADAANAAQTGTDAATSLDTVFDTTEALVLASAAPAAAPSDRMQALAAGNAAPITTATVACAGGGTATLTISGGTLATQLNGRFDGDEHYTVTYAQCTGAAGYAQLDGGVEMDITSVAGSSTPATTAANITATELSLALPAGTAVLNGSATVSRSTSTADGTTTTVSHAAVPSATLATPFNARSGSFTLSDLDATRTVQSVAGATTASQYSGHHTLSGDANGRTFSMTVSTTGNVAYDAAGALVSGQWTVVRQRATIVTAVADGTVVMTVDDGNDGTIDHTWTFSRAQLDATAG